MTDSDRDVVRDVRRGNRDAFSKLVAAYQGRLFGLVLMMVRQPAAAEDVTQDAFVRAYLHLDRYDERRPFYPWIATIGVRLAQNRLRAHSRTRERERPLADEEPEDGARDAPVGALIAGEQERALWQAVSALPSGERTAVLLYYRDELPVQDIAHALGVSAGTIKTLLFRARRRLRGHLQSQMGTRRESST